MDRFTKNYLETTFNLAKTIVVKSSITADRINDHLDLVYGAGGVDRTDPTTWKYYLNLAGEYHTTDEKMIIKSLDTYEDIVFSKEILKTHKVTYKEYQYGTEYYKALVLKYPNQESLILGILNPVDIPTAIEAADGSILSYSKDLVEPQEQTLMLELEQWCKDFQIRWNVKGYYFTDDLYPAAQLAVMYMGLLQKILNLRLKRALTPEAHSYHIRVFLGSHKYLDKFIDKLNLNQLYWLYRNIRYVERNLGDNETIQYVIDNILKPSYIPIDALRLEQLDNITSGLPNYQFTADPLSVTFNRPNVTGYKLIEVANRELRAPADTGGYLFKDYYYSGLEETDKKLKYTNTSNLSTKILQSDMIDYGDTSRRRLETIVLDYWSYGIATGDYRAYVLFRDPNTNKSTLLNGRDAWIVFTYMILRWMKMPSDIIPEWYYTDVERTDVTLTELMEDVYPGSGLEKYAEKIYRTIPGSLTATTVSEFKDITLRAYDRVINEWIMIGAMGDPFRRGVVRDMCNKTRRSHSFTIPETGTPFSGVLYNLGLEDAYLNPKYDHYGAMVSILEAATGYNFDDKFILTKIQQHLLSLLGKLKSYTTQLVYNSDYYPLIMLDRHVQTTDSGSCKVTTHDWVAINNVAYNAERMVHDTYNTNHKSVSLYDTSLTDKIRMDRKSIHTMGITVKETIVVGEFGGGNKVYGQTNTATNMVVTPIIIDPVVDNGPGDTLNTTITDTITSNIINVSASTYMSYTPPVTQGEIYLTTTIQSLTGTPTNDSQANVDIYTNFDSTTLNSTITGFSSY